jgi:ABC-type transport system involved in multi-copper enzyme maturation permease subunit
MRIRVWKALAKGVLLESLRRKDLWVVAILGFLILMAAGALGFFGTEGLEVFVKDLAGTVLGLFSTVVAVMTASRLLPEEIQRKTLYPLLARPISRMDLLIGKLAGAIAVTWSAFFILAILTGFALATFGVAFEGIMLQYMLAKMLGLAVLCAVTLTLSTYMTPGGAATMSLVLAFGSSMIIRGLVLAYEGTSPAVQWVFKAVNWMLPQYGLFDFSSRASNIGWPLVPMWVLVALFIYAAIYSSAMVGMSWAKFRKQAL